jgi:hypothetical protein
MAGALRDAVKAGGEAEQKRAAGGGDAVEAVFLVEFVDGGDDGFGAGAEDSGFALDVEEVEVAGGGGLEEPDAAVVGVPDETGELLLVQLSLHPAAPTAGPERQPRDLDAPIRCPPPRSLRETHVGSVPSRVLLDAG